MKNWTTNDIPSQKGKLYLVTGANSGTGFATAKTLAQKGAKIIMAVRNMDKGENAVSKIKNDVPDAKLELMHLDLTDLNSIEKFVADFTNQHHNLDVLINNAGIALPNKRTETKQGFEGHFGINHLGHFALTGKLLPILKATKSARIVTVASFVPKQSKSIMNWNDLQYIDKFDGMTSYGQSKLANIMFGLQLDKKLDQSNCPVISVLANPGFTKSGMQKDMGFIAKSMTFFMSHSTEMGMLPILRCAVDPNVKGGEFYGPLKMKEMRGYPELTEAPEPALIEEDRQKLWKISEQMTNTTYNFS